MYQENLYSENPFGQVRQKSPYYSPTPHFFVVEIVIIRVIYVLLKKKVTDVKILDMKFI